MRRSAAILALLIASSAARTETASPMERAARLAKVAPGVALFFGMGARRSEAPVILELAGAGALDAVSRTGARLARARNGAPLGHGRFVAARASVEALEALAALDAVVRIHADGAPLAFPAPLNRTGAEIQAPDVWPHQGAQGLALTGQGVAICLIDSGIDVLHPLFFRADGGYHRWIDRDGDGRFTSGVDAVRIGDREALLRVLDGRIYGPSAEQPILGSESSALDAGLDWLYADLDGDGTRDAGRDAGFDDAAPSFGEPLFVVDDVIDDDRLDRHEKLVALGSSKIAAVHTAEVDYLRGESLIDVPAAGGSHGSASASVLVAGARGLGRIVGIAPDAELSIALRGDSVAELYAHTAWCISMGARVVLHEYAPWQGFFLDGSSPLEQLIDESSAAGVAHVNPAGNLSTADKLYKRAHPAASTVDIAIAVPDDAPYAIVGMSLLWRDAARPVTLTLTDPTGHSRVLPETGQLVEAWHDGLSLYAARDVSARGTVRADAYLADPERRRSLPAGSWRVEVQHGGAPGDRPLEIIAYLADDLSGWGKGIHFPDHVSEDHLIGHPGTADASIAVAAYALHGFWGSSPGQRAFYSGRGYRIDGVEILSLAAPEDPIAAGWRDGEPATYQTFGGTSGASPHVAGAAALVLQAHPEWSGGEVRDALREGALADAAVGPAPNRDWGWGKLRIHRSLFGADPSGGPPVVAVEERRLTVGERARLRIEIADPDDPLAALEVELDRDYDGSYEERIAGGFWVSYDAPGSYAHKIRAVDPDGREGTALARVEVVAASRLEAAGGCALGGRGAQGWLWLFGGWALSRARGTRRWCAPGPRRARSGR